MTVGVWLRESKVDDVIVVLKLIFEDKRVVTKLSLLFNRRLVSAANQTLQHTFIHATYCTLCKALVVLSRWVEVSIDLFNPVFLITVRSSRQCVFLSPLDLGLDELEAVRPNAHPLRVLAVLRFEHYTLK